MPIVADEYTHVIGVDTHSETHTYAVIDSVTGRLLKSETFPTSAPGLDRAVKWILRQSKGAHILAAVEGTNSYGAGLVSALGEASIPFAEARPPRRELRAGRGKSDPIDAEAAARSVLRQDTGMLIRPRAGKIRSALRVLLTARRSMDSQRTADRNALTALLRTIPLGIDARKPLTDNTITLIASWRVRQSDDIEFAIARQEAIRLARSILQLTMQLQDNHALLRQQSSQLAPGFLEIKGVGPVTAAVFLTAYSHLGRVRNEAAFAALAGASPIPASSGNTTRYRLNRHGDRQLNAALDVVARVRLAADPDTKAYKQRRLAEGKTSREIRRLLKRYIARQIYRQLTQTMASTA